MEVSAGNGRNLGFQQILEATAYELKEGASGGALLELSQFGGAIMDMGHDLCSVRW